MKAEDWLDMPARVDVPHYVHMTSAERKVYQQLKETKVLPLLEGKLTKDIENADHAVLGDTAAALSGKLLQMANGAVYDDTQNVVPIHDAKLDALEELADTNAGNNLLVFYAYQHDRERLLKRFPKAREFTGPSDVMDWNAGKIPMLLCHPASTGHGLNLQQGGHIIVLFGLTWSLELYQQANARLPRPGQKESVIIHHLVCRDTVDEQLMDALQDKNAGQNALLNALKGYLNKEGT
jgi:SNF2 family DNA or RNA helicase